MKKRMMTHLLINRTLSPYSIREQVRSTQQYCPEDITEDEAIALLEVADDIDKRAIVGGRERKQLAKIYPLFSWEFYDDRGGGNYRHRNSSANFLHVDESRALHDHGLLSIERDLRTLYPHLCILVMMDRGGVNISTWVDRDGHSGAAISGELSLTQPDLHQRLKERDEQAALAHTPDRFFCTGHNAVEEGARDYFYFAGDYCALYGQEHPKHKQAALAETYN